MEERPKYFYIFAFERFFFNPQAPVGFIHWKLSSTHWTVKGKKSAKFLRTKKGMIFTKQNLKQ